MFNSILIRCLLLYIIILLLMSILIYIYRSFFQKGSGFAPDSGLILYAQTLLDPHMEGSGISNPYGFEGPVGLVSRSVWVILLFCCFVFSQLQGFGFSPQFYRAPLRRDRALWSVLRTLPGRVGWGRASAVGSGEPVQNIRLNRPNGVNI